MTADLPLIPVAPPARSTVANSLRIMAWINRLQAARHDAHDRPLMARHHAEAADDFQASAERIENPLRTIIVL